MLWEAQFLSALQGIRMPFLDFLMSNITLLGEYGVFGVLVGIVLLCIPKTRRTGIQILISMALAFILANLIIKNVVARPRPYETYTYLIPLGRMPHDTSFPSGHCVNIFACATSIFLEHKKAGVIALIVAALVAFSRLYNCVHYPTDVLAGTIIGIGMALLVHYLIFPACETGFGRLKARKGD